jgi:inorganic pyrophosphatase
MIDKETVKKLVGLCKLIDKSEEQTKILFKVVDKLEQRIATLEKVLQSHAKCIGEMREKKDDA